MKYIIIIALLAMASPAMAIDESESICSDSDLTQVITFWTNHWIDETWTRMDRQQPGIVDKLMDQGGNAFILALANHMESISSEGARELKRRVFNECRVRLDDAEALSFWNRFVYAIRHEDFLME